jgi:predicted GNAT family N-acyltransferase
VGAGRLLMTESGAAKIGRIAVLASVRSAGIGRQLLDALMAAARHRGCNKVVLHAQADAVSFYERAGFLREGPVFTEAGIAHQAMGQALG